MIPDAQDLTDMTREKDSMEATEKGTKVTRWARLLKILSRSYNFLIFKGPFWEK